MSPIHGLILAGGFSRRMGRDKATLALDGRTLLERAIHHFKALEIPFAVSARKEQFPDSRGIERIDDPVPAIGPAGGLIQALQARPGKALLVIPVDLPWLDTATLRQLLDRRDPLCHVTAFRSPGDERVDPLCAVYEPSSLSIIQRAVAHGRTSLRRILENDVRLNLIEPGNPEALADADWPADLSAGNHQPSAPEEPCRPST